MLILLTKAAKRSLCLNFEFHLKNNMPTRLTLLAILLLSVCAGCRNKSNTLFERLDAHDTGIAFNNINVENDAINIFTYEYLYNGGGVAVGDINNDGLPDIYFSSNNLENKLYLNKGDFKFEDITDKAGAGCKQGWKTGVSMVDINGDGWLDIYVCRSADSSPANRRNSLLINNHDLTFTDRAHEYGLDDDSYSTHAAFFDFDRDGDLDCFLLNHSLLSISNSFNISNINRRLRYPYVGNKFMRNDNGHFKDLTDSVGIVGGTSNYGLGIGVSDINNDGWPDLYVSNDYVDNDKLYINKSGKYFIDVTDSMLTHVSQFSMGLDIADVNNDGFTDILTLDMLPEDNKRQKLLFGPDKYDVLQTSVKNGYHHQYMRNMLQLNNGDGSFSEIGQLTGISNTDWSWSALLADYDNDGLQDLFISNGYKRDFTNNDFLKYKADQEIKSMSRDGKRNYAEMLKKMPSNKLHNYIFKNKDGLMFENKVREWGFDDKLLTNGAVYADLDNDGDLDLVMNNIDEAAGVYRNQSDSQNHSFLKIKLIGTEMNSQGIGSKVFCFTQGKKQVRELYPVRGFQSSVEPTLFFGFNKTSIIDSVIVEWPSGSQSKQVNITTNQLLSVNQSGAVPARNKMLAEKKLFTEIKDALVFAHHENDFIDFKVQTLLPRMYSASGPAMASGDVNADHLTDIFIGGAKGQHAELFIQNKDGKFTSKLLACFKDEPGVEIADAIFFDKDNDGDLDLYTVNGGYENNPNDKPVRDCIYENDGAGNFMKVTNALPDFVSNGSCVRSSDVDSDGDLDLFIGGRIIAGRYPETPESFMLLNDGKGNFKIATSLVAPDLKTIGMVTDALWLDLNQDQKEDLVVVGEWMPISFFVNKNGKLVNKTNDYIKDATAGWWNCITAADVDLDGDKDLVIGNFGMNNQMKPSAKRPVSIFYSDIDANGSVDPILTYFIMGKEYPYPNRDELTEQLPSIKKRFIDFESYSDATISDILKPEELKKIKKLSASTFETSLYLNTGKGFTKSNLPIQAQYAPIFSILVEDLNHDSRPDLLMVGNLEKTRVRTGKYSGDYGFLFIGDGKGNFEYMPQYLSGLSLRGDVKHVISDSKCLIFGVNNASVKVYKK